MFDSFCTLCTHLSIGFTRQESLEWVAMPSSCKRLPDLGMDSASSYVSPCTAEGEFFITSATLGESFHHYMKTLSDLFTLDILSRYTAEFSKGCMICDVIPLRLMKYVLHILCFKTFSILISNMVIIGRFNPPIKISLESWIVFKSFK